MFFENTHEPVCTLRNGMEYVPTPERLPTFDEHRELAEREWEETKWDRVFLDQEDD